MANPYWFTHGQKTNVKFLMSQTFIGIESSKKLIRRRARPYGNLVK